MQEWACKGAQLVAFGGESWEHVLGERLGGGSPGAPPPHSRMQLEMECVAWLKVQPARWQGARQRSQL